MTEDVPRWKDRGRIDNSPPPPYEEYQRSHQDSKNSPGQLHADPVQGKTPRRRHPATTGRKVAGNSVRHRKPIPNRFHATAYGHQPGPSQPVPVQDNPSGPFDFRFGQAEEEAGEAEAEDEVRQCFPPFSLC